ncbi:MAG: ATP-grasp domain-containing protein [Acidimicrobiia bacterium]
MILLCGIPSETPLAMVAQQLTELGAPFVMFNQRRFSEYRLEYNIVAGKVNGWMELTGKRYELSSFTAAYARLMDDRLLPELSDEPEGSPSRLGCRELHDTLTRWLEITPARVVSRYGSMGSNGSKPYQAQLITAHGFRTPETLVTNDPEAVRTFRRHHGRIIYKSVSGLRSIVTEFSEEDDSRLEAIRSCPTQFQALIEGIDVRLHVVGDEVFATAIESHGTDYRYASGNGDETRLSPIQAPDDVERRAVALAADLGLPVAGIDLMIDEDGDVYCLEVNPSPAFSYYEQHTGQPIALAIARYLSGGNGTQA